MLSAQWWDTWLLQRAPTMAQVSNSTCSSCPIFYCTFTAKGVYGLIGEATLTSEKKLLAGLPFF